jgi:predicted dehydrogenase
MSKIWKVGVVGLSIGRSHIIEGYENNRAHYQVLAVCDLNEERLNAVANEFSVERRTMSFEELLAMPDIDIVDICTPPSLHVPMAIAALRAGKHVVCEKPLASSLADADQLAEVVKETGRQLMPIFQYRYGNGVMKAKHIIEQSIAGKPYMATVETAWKRTPEYYAVPWRGKWDTEFGGVLVSHAIHIHDMLTFLMGPVASVFCRTATQVNAIEVEDCAAATLTLESGALATLSATLGSQREISRLRLCFENVTVESSLEPYQPGNDPWAIIAASPEVQERIDVALMGWTDVPSRFAGLMQRFHRALDEGAPMPVTPADARRSLELVTALYHSSETDTIVTLPIGPDHPKYANWRPHVISGQRIAATA